MAKGIKTHFVKKLNDREQLCKKVAIVPLEIVTRNILAGSTARSLGVGRRHTTSQYYL